MKLLFKCCFGILLLIALPAFGSSFVFECLEIARQGRIHQGFLIGFAAYAPIHFLIVRRWCGLATFVHELTHALVSLLFLRRVTMFVVTARNGGAVGHTRGFGGRLGDTAISLAPYCFPMFAITLALARPLFLSNAQPYFDIALGAALGFHFWTALADLRQAFKDRKFVAVDGSVMKSDIGKWGIFYSAVVIAFFWIFFYGFVLAQLRGGYDGAWLFLRRGAVGGWENGIFAFRWIYEAVRGRIAGP